MSAWKSQESKTMDRRRAFKECPHCGLSVHYKSIKEHLAEHGETGVPADGKYWHDRETVSLAERIESLKKVIGKLEGKARKSKGDLDLLVEYRDGLEQLERRYAEQI